MPNQGETTYLSLSRFLIGRCAQYISVSINHIGEQAILLTFEVFAMIVVCQIAVFQNAGFQKL